MATMETYDKEILKPTTNYAKSRECHQHGISNCGVKNENCGVKNARESNEIQVKNSNLKSLINGTDNILCNDTSIGEICYSPIFSLEIDNCQNPNNNRENIYTGKSKDSSTISHTNVSQQNCFNNVNMPLNSYIVKSTNSPLLIRTKNDILTNIDELSRCFKKQTSFYT